MVTTTSVPNCVSGVAYTQAIAGDGGPCTCALSSGGVLKGDFGVFASSDILKVAVVSGAVKYDHNGP